MELQKETDWRRFFTDPELHQTICLATVLLLGKVLDHAVKSKFISKEEYHRKISELKSFSTNDIGTVDSLFFLNCNLKVQIRIKNPGQLRNIPWSLEESKCDYYQNNRDKILFLKWRVREAKAICSFLREARNIQHHDNKKRPHLGWLLIVPSSILRLLEICPQNNDKISEAFEKLRVICNEQVNDLITTNGGQKSENIKEEQNSQEQSSAENLFAQEAKVINSKLDNEAKAINTKLDNIVSILSNTTAIEVNKSELQTRAVVDDQEITYAEEEQTIATEDAFPEVDLLTPNMVRNELSYLAKSHSENYQEFIFGSPAENLLQIAIIDEILSGRPKKASEILTLPDVAWRYKEHKKSMKKQFDVLKPSLENILSRAEWDE